MVATPSVRRGDVYLVDLGSSRGSVMRKTRPCVIVSPDTMNSSLRSFIVAPLTSGSHDYPYRIPCRFKGKAGHIVLDQIRAADRSRLLRRLGKLPPTTTARALSVLQETFAV